MTDEIKKPDDHSTEIPVSIINSEDTPKSEDPILNGPEVSLDSYMRLQAEFSNFRKRIKKEQAQSYSYAQGELIKTLLPVIDDFDRMIRHHEEEIENHSREDLSHDGILLIYQNLKKILTEQGLEEIPALGERFDPEIHEAVMAIETNPDMDNIVMEVWLTGYRLNGRVLRPAKVKVGRHTEMGDFHS